MPEFEIAWEIHLSKNSPGPLVPPSEGDLAAVYPAVVERPPIICVTSDGGQTAVIGISQRTSAGDARTAAMYIRSGNPFASDAGIANVLGDAAIGAVVSVLTVTDTESGAVTQHDKGQHRPDDSAVVVAGSPPRPARRTRGRGRPRLVRPSEVEEPAVVEPEAEVEEPEVEESEPETEIEGGGV